MTNAVIEVRRQNVVTQVNRFCKQHGGEGSATFDDELGVILVHYVCKLNDTIMAMEIPITVSEASKVNVYTVIVRRIASQIFEKIREESY